MPPGIDNGCKMRILSYQATPMFADIVANIAKIKTMCTAGALFDVEVAVFPELFLTGYNLGDKAGQLAMPLDSQYLAELCQIAISTGVAIIAGFPELDNGAIHNSAVAIDRTGRIVGHHRKVYLFGDKEKAIYTPGDRFETFEIAGRKCGLSICYDIEFPEVSRDLKRRGADVIFVPTANMVPYFDVPTILVRSRALENGLAIVYANLCGVEGNQTYTGLSAIIGPDGKDIARAGANEAMLISDIHFPLDCNTVGTLSTQITDLSHARLSRARRNV